MKNLLLIYFFLFFGNTLFAQSNVEIEQPIFEKQVGLNFTNFVLRFISFQQSLQNTPSILVLYKKKKKGKTYRYGIGGRIRWLKIMDESIFDTGLNVNIGREYPCTIGKRWTAYYGWETLFIGTYEQRKFTPNFSMEEEKTFSRSASLGWKILGGVQYKFNSRLSLLTETSYGLIFNYVLLASKTERYSAQSFYNAPTSLILSYHF